MLNKILTMLQFKKSPSAKWPHSLSYNHRGFIVEEMKSPNGAFKCFLAKIQNYKGEVEYFQAYSKSEVNSFLDEAVRKGATLPPLVGER